jgi:gas vesicle protein
MTFLDRLLSPVRDAGKHTRQRATLAARGSDGGPSWPVTTAIGLAGAAIGAGAAFLLDPARGRARRARIVDQTVATARRTGRRVARAGRRLRSDAGGRIEAWRAESDAMPRPTDDATVTDRVRSEVFRDPSISRANVSINVERGIVVLRGEVADATTRHQLIDRVERVEGVWSVRDQLHLPGEAAPAREAVASRD